MSGIYIHIPFCKKRCLYCDFFSTTQLNRRAEYVEALLREIEQRKNETGEPIRTIYIGGGTPSMLDTIDVFRIVRTIGMENAEEITMEVNPGDVSPKYLSELRQTGVNRLSIGVQSFKDELLHAIGRRHSAIQAVNAVHMAQETGFDNISIDLMYALPGQTLALWKADIELALRLGVQHISSYGLMYEEGTMLTKMRDTGEIKPINENTENKMYDYLCHRLKQAGFIHYEVSNFALPGYEALHNSNYWNGTPYIGIGAAAHSYTIARQPTTGDQRTTPDDQQPTHTRSWNPDNLNAYITGILAHKLRRKSETLTPRDLYNERVMLGLRTNKGIKLSELMQTAIDPDGTPTVHRQLTGTLEELCKEKLLRKTDDNRIVATQKGIHILNRIIEDLMIDE